MQPTPTLPDNIAMYYQTMPVSLAVMSGLNQLYTYVDNNPQNYIDPLGLGGNMARNSTVEMMFKGVENAFNNLREFPKYNEPLLPSLDDFNRFLNPKWGKYVWFCSERNCPQSCPIPGSRDERACPCRRWKVVFMRF